MHRNGGTHLTRIVVHYTPEYPAILSGTSLLLKSLYAFCQKTKHSQVLFSVFVSGILTQNNSNYTA